MSIKKQNKYLLYFLISIFIIGCTSRLKLSVPPVSELETEADWLTLGKNNQHKHYSTENITPPLEVVWQRRVKSVTVDHPLALNNFIIVSTRDGMLHQIDYSTGDLLSNGRIGLGIEHVPTIEQDALYAGFSLGHPSLVGLSLNKGDRVLARKEYQVNTTPLFWKDRLYFGTNQWIFQCINPFVDTEIWRHQARAPIQSSPALQPPNIIFGDEKGWLYCLDASGGSLQWEKQLDGNIFSHPVIDESLVFIGTIKGKLYAININNGELKWEKKFQGAFYSSPSVYEDKIYIGNNAHQVLCLKKESGEIIWDFKTEGIVNTVPLPSPDYLYVTSWDKNLYVLDRNLGNLVYKMNFNRPIKSSPIIYKNLLLIHVANEHLFALTNGSFAENWGK